METIFSDLKERYKSKRRELLTIAEPEKHWILELFPPPKLSHEIIEKELELYEKFHDEIDSFQGLRKKEISNSEWKKLIGFLKNSAERSSARVDSLAIATAVFAVIAMSLMALSKSFHWIYYMPLIGLAWFSIQIHGNRSMLRNDVATNRELAFIFEQYVAN